MVAVVAVLVFLPWFNLKDFFREPPRRHGIFTALVTAGAFGLWGLWGGVLAFGVMVFALSVLLSDDPPKPPSSGITEL